MTSPVQTTAAVTEHVRLARDTYRIQLSCPVLAAAIRPGQFLMVRLRGGTDPLLGRPFALYDVIRDEHGQPSAIDIVYQVIGKWLKGVYPVSTGLIVEGLAKPESLMEIDVTAVIPIDG